MKQFIAIFKKVGGWQVLRGWMRARVFLYAMAQTLLSGFSRKGLEIVRLGVEHKIYRRLRRQNAKFIENFKNTHDPAQWEHKHNPRIWTIWLQGMENAPEVVQKCYASMCRHITDREIVVITDDNYSDYVTFPEHIMEKYRKGIISKVHFSDLLRIELMAQHGGTWLDGTVFCSDTPQSFMVDSQLFLFQTLKPGFDGHSTSISSWLMTAHSGNPIILLTRALLHEYWRNYNYAVDYFILHNFFQMAIEAYPEEWAKVVPFSNATPHNLLLRLFEPYNEVVWQGMKAQTQIHKLSYKFTPEDAQKEGTFYREVLKNF